MESEAFVFGEISFLILLSLVWTSDIISLIILKTSIFIEDFPRNKHSWLDNQSQIILYSTTYWPFSQSNVLIYICGKNITSTYQVLIGHPIKQQYRSLVYKGSQPTPCSEISLFTLNKTKIKDLINLSKDLTVQLQRVGKCQLRTPWFKMDQCTNKTPSLLTFCLDNLQV